MNSRNLIIVTSLTLCGLSVAGVASQSHQLQALRNEGQRLRQQLETVQPEKAAPATTLPVAKPTVDSPSVELLRLRNQVSQLARRERQLAGVQVENERLRTQVASARTNAVAQLPASYIRKSEARNLGYATPEATIETYLWAVRNRDLDAMLACFTAEAATHIRQEFGQNGRSLEQLLERSEAVPGINVLDRVRKSDDVLEYKVEMVPGSGASEPMPFRRINGEWKFGPPR